MIDKIHGVRLQDSASVNLRFKITNIHGYEHGKHSIRTVLLQQQQQNCLMNILDFNN